MEWNLQKYSMAEINGYEHSHQSKRNLQNCICERDKHRLRLLLPSMCGSLIQVLPREATRGLNG